MPHETLLLGRDVVYFLGGGRFVQRKKKRKKTRFHVQARSNNDKIIQASSQISDFYCYRAHFRAKVKYIIETHSWKR
jgi:hypothetical protein